MFRRIVFEDWTLALPVLAFVFTAGLFLWVTVRAMLLPADRRERLARIPLSNLSSEDVSTEKPPTRSEDV